MRVALINSVCRPRDAIGEAMWETYRAVTAQPGWRCRLFTFETGFAGMDTTRVHGVGDLVTNPDFIGADVHLYHFGVFSELMTALAVGRPETRRIVRFHNITPHAFAPPSQHALLDRSLEQVALLDFADEIWADSSYNARDLVAFGLDSARIRVEPLFAKPRFQTGSLPDKPRDRANLLYVGRFVASKGVLDLVGALALLRDRVATPFHLSLVGALRSSDPAYLDQVRDAIADAGLDRHATLVGEVDDATLARLYRDAHLVVIPSYHEGFCVPLVEAMYARAVPVATDSGNMPDLIRGMGAIVPTGNQVALATALRDLIDWFGQFWAGRIDRLPVGAETLTLSDYDARVREHTAQFSLTAFHARAVGRLAAAVAAKETC